MHRSPHVRVFIQTEQQILENSDQPRVTEYPLHVHMSFQGDASVPLPVLLCAVVMTVMMIMITVTMMAMMFFSDSSFQLIHWI